MNANINSNINSKFDNMQCEITALRADMQDMRQSMQYQLDKATEQSETAVSVAKNLEAEIEALKHKLDKSNVQQAKLAHTCDELRNRCINLESYSRRENLIIKGIAKTEGEDVLNKVKCFFVNDLKLDHDIVKNMILQRCHRLNKYDTIICRFLSFPDRQKVWGARSKLSGTQLILSEDFPPEVNERRQSLFPIFKEAKKQKMQAKLQGDKLVIDGLVYTVDSLNRLPSALDPALIATKTVNDVTAFFTSASPLSPFFAY